MAEHQNGRPIVACEISSERVIAARATRSHDSLEAFRSFSLPAGTVTPGLTSANIAGPEALQQAISDALIDIAGRNRDVIAILPVAAVRVVLLDFEALPDRPKEAESVVRFRLKKSLPFDVDKAAISYDTQQTSAGLRVIAAVTVSSILQEYENAFRAAGYTPGVVVPSSLAALGTVDASRPTMVLKVDAGTITVAIVNREQLLLFRTLENVGHADISGERLSEDVYPSLVFFQDTYGVNVERVLVAGVTSVQTIAGPLEAQTGARVDELVSSSVAGSGSNLPRGMLSGVVGALIS
jgi:type IV pilus assembly protein PilM